MFFIIFKAAFREDMLHRDIEDLQKRYQVRTTSLAKVLSLPIFCSVLVRFSFCKFNLFFFIQASERRCEELITQVPDSTRPLLRQIEAMQVQHIINELLIYYKD